jgi:hypothetical protein
MGAMVESQYSNRYDVPMPSVVPPGPQPYHRLNLLECRREESEQSSKKHSIIAALAEDFDEPEDSMDEFPSSTI